MSTALIPVLAPPEEFHDDSVPAFEASVTPHLGGAGPGIVFDLGDVKFISSSGLAFFVRVGMSLDGKRRRIALARSQKRVAKLLRMTGLESLLPQFKSVEAAREFVAAAGSGNP